MNFIIDNKEWIFSGIGVFLLGLLIGWIREIRKNGFKEYKDGFFIPNTLSFFRHGDLDEYKVPLIARRIMSVKSLRNKKLLIKYPIFTTGTLDAAVSLSDPGRMKLIQPSEVESHNSIEIISRKNAQYLIVSESKRTSFPTKMCNPPSEFNKVIHSLVENRIKTEKHDFCGTRVIAHTRSLRIIVEFSSKFKPNFVHPIQIDENGNIIRDEKSTDFIMATQRDGTLFIVDLHEPEVNSGVYVWWEWPDIT
jgi:hypothetical protein